MAGGLAEDGGEARSQGVDGRPAVFEGERRDGGLGGALRAVPLSELHGRGGRGVAAGLHWRACRQARRDAARPQQC